MVWGLCDKNLLPYRKFALWFWYAVYKNHYPGANFSTELLRQRTQMSKGFWDVLIFVIYKANSTLTAHKHSFGYMAGVVLWMCFLSGCRLDNADVHFITSVLVICFQMKEKYNNFILVHPIVFLYHEWKYASNTTLHCHTTQCYMFRFTWTIIRHLFLQQFQNKCLMTVHMNQSLWHCVVWC